MKLLKLHIFIFILSVSASAQKSLDLLLIANNSESIPYITVEELVELQTTNSVLIMDAREKEEFDVSHIEGAIYVGYNSFSIESISTKMYVKNNPIIVYCSLGIRSEKIGEKLEKSGFTNVKNLYGGIFEWKNNDYPIVDSTGNRTERIHAYSKIWGLWLTKGKKVY